MKRNRSDKGRKLILPRKRTRKMGSKQKLLLLNPPAKKPVFRDCYCSGRFKGRLLIHPLDLQIQSGFLSEDGFELDFVDAVFEQIHPDQTIERIRSFDPDVILSLVGEAVLDEDAAFFRQIKLSLPSARLFLSGDAARFRPERLLQRIPEAEGLLTDFGTAGLSDHLNGRVSPHLRVRGADASSSFPKSFAYPLPWKGFVRKYPYQLPFFPDPKYHSIAASFGCPYHCRYCNTHLLGYRNRDIGEFVEELEFAASHGFRSLYVRDATFMADKARTLCLFDEWRQMGCRFHWICFTRPDLIDEELAARASELGCVLMMMGVESFDETWLGEMGRHLHTDTMKNAFRLLRKHRIRSAAQIMIGMESRGSDLHIYEARLRSFLKEIDPDFISLNLFFRRPGIMDESPSFRRIESDEALYREMGERISRSFYFHPRSLLRQTYLLKSPKQLVLSLKAAVGMINLTR